MEKIALTMQELSVKIDTFMLYNYSHAQIDDMTDDIEASAVIVFNKVQTDASGEQLREELQAFTPHDSCQLSLIRDVLTERRNRQSSTTGKKKAGIAA